MPTMSAPQVSVLPLKTRSASSLTEIRDAMLKNPPEIETHTGGWASVKNHESNLGMYNAAPPVSSPEIHPAKGQSPEMLQARFYYWESPPPGLRSLPNLDPGQGRRLAAVDLVITRVDDGHIGLLVSSRTSQVLNRKDGVLRSLESILRDGDDTIRVPRSGSHLELRDTDIFLWLTVQNHDEADLAPDLRLGIVSSISGRDASARTAYLRSGVDFGRPNFLTAVAEADTLGPIELSFVHDLPTEARSYKVTLHIDGGFTIRKKEIHIPSAVDTETLMLEATFALAFHLVPRINNLYGEDDKWADRRLEVIEGAMTDLQERYRLALAALKERLDSSPTPLGADVDAGIE